MKKLLTSIYIILMFTSVAAQNDLTATEAMVNEFTEQLEQRGISNWFYVKKYCTGSIEMFKMSDGKMCSSKGTYFEFFVLWQEEDKTMIKKIDNCGLFYSMPLSDNVLWDFVKENRSTFEKQSVKPYESAEITGKPESRTAVHPCNREFLFNLEGAGFDQKFNLFQLTTSDNLPNKNYEFNNNLKLVELHRMLEPIFEKSLTTFRRQ